VSKTIKELLIISDSSPGQNRNHVVVRFLVMLAANGRFKKIFEYFPVRGPCDRDFGLTKKKSYTNVRFEHPVVEISIRKLHYLYFHTHNNNNQFIDIIGCL
jgi:hypothetical protein